MSCLRGVDWLKLERHMLLLQATPLLKCCATFAVTSMYVAMRTAW